MSHLSHERDRALTETARVASEARREAADRDVALSHYTLGYGYRVVRAVQQVEHIRLTLG